MGCNANTKRVLPIIGIVVVALLTLCIFLGVKFYNPYSAPYHKVDGKIYTGAEVLSLMETIIEGKDQISVCVDNGGITQYYVYDEEGKPTENEDYKLLIDGNAGYAINKDNEYKVNVVYGEKKAIKEIKATLVSQEDDTCYWLCDYSAYNDKTISGAELINLIVADGSYGDGVRICVDNGVVSRQYAYDENGMIKDASVKKEIMDKQSDYYIHPTGKFICTYTEDGEVKTLSATRQ